MKYLLACIALLIFAFLPIMILQLIREIIWRMRFCSSCQQPLTEYGFYGMKDCLNESCKKYKYRHIYRAVKENQSNKGVSKEANKEVQT